MAIWAEVTSGPKGSRVMDHWVLGGLEGSLLGGFGWRMRIVWTASEWITMRASMVDGSRPCGGVWVKRSWVPPGQLKGLMAEWLRRASLALEISSGSCPASHSPRALALPVSPAPAPTGGASAMSLSLSRVTNIQTMMNVRHRNGIESQAVRMTVCFRMGDGMAMGE